MYFKAPKHTHTPQTPTRIALAHSTNVLIRQDLVYNVGCSSVVRGTLVSEGFVRVQRTAYSTVPALQLQRERMRGHERDTSRHEAEAEMNRMRRR